MSIFQRFTVALMMVFAFTATLASCDGIYDVIDVPNPDDVADCLDVCADEMVDCANECGLDYPDEHTIPCVLNCLAVDQHCVAECARG